jgi:activator of HSP90 ATPase
MFFPNDLASKLKENMQQRQTGHNSSSNIVLSCTINADARRIFQALIEPEYRELWMRMPSQDEGGHICASKSRDLFRLDYHRFGKLEVSIFGSYHTCRRRRQVFSWWKNAPNSTVSLVELCLEGSFSSSVLRLTHRGLDTKAEYVWHTAMWRASLARLTSIF